MAALQNNLENPLGNKDEHTDIKVMSYETIPSDSLMFKPI
jgi:hypothetical protein